MTVSDWSVASLGPSGGRHLAPVDVSLPTVPGREVQ